MAKGGAILFAIALLGFVIGLPLVPTAGQGGATSDDALHFTLGWSIVLFGFGGPGDQGMSDQLVSTG